MATCRKNEGGAAWGKGGGVTWRGKKVELCGANQGVGLVKWKERRGGVVGKVSESFFSVKDERKK